MQTITRANLSVYPVDPRGLVVDQRFDPQSKRISSAEQSRLELGQTQATMLELADATGGEAFYNRNDIDNAIRSAVRDGENSYTLGFYPDEKDLTGSIHKLKLRLPHDSSVNLRYRKTYSEAPLKEPDVNTRKAQVSEASWGPMDANGLPLGSSLIRSTASSSVQVQTLIGTKALSLFPEGDRWTDNLDVLVVQRDKAGKVLDGSYDTLDLRLKPETYQALLRNGYIHRKEIRLLPKAASIRVVVRDDGSGEVGSVTIPL
jgi:hypothetical protein